MALSALGNLATCTADEDAAPAGMTRLDGKHFLSEMIACGLMKAVALLRDRHFDVTGLHNLLNENYKEMTRGKFTRTKLNLDIYNGDLFIPRHASRKMPV